MNGVSRKVIIYVIKYNIIEISKSGDIWVYSESRGKTCDTKRNIKTGNEEDNCPGPRCFIIPKAQAVNPILPNTSFATGTFL